MGREIIWKCNKIFPWFGGFSGDLLFFVAIDTLWFTVVKGLSAAQFVSLTTISLIVCIILQAPILKLIHHFGNTKSVRLGVILLFISAILLTWGPNYGWLIIGKIIYELSLSFRNMDSALLKNNLNLLHLGNEEFIRIKNRASTIYSTITAIIAFTVAYIFNLNHYLPMYLCVGFCVVNCILAFCIRDFSENTRRKHILDEKIKLNVNPFIMTAIVAYGLFYPLLDSAQNNGKLFIQDDMLNFFSTPDTAKYLLLIVAASRVIRIISNLVFGRIYARFKDKVINGISVGLALSIALMMLGFYLPAIPLVKFMVMGFGYLILLGVRDPFRTYLQDLVLSHSSKSNQQAGLIYLELGRKIGSAIFNISASLMLLQVTLTWVMWLSLVLAIVEIGVCIKLYRIVIR